MKLATSDYVDNKLRCKVLTLFLSSTSSSTSPKEDVDRFISECVGPSVVFSEETTTPIALLASNSAYTPAVGEAKNYITVKKNGTVESHLEDSAYSAGALHLLMTGNNDDYFDKDMIRAYVKGAVFTYNNILGVECSTGEYTSFE